MKNFQLNLIRNREIHETTSTKEEEHQLDSTPMFLRHSSLPFQAAAHGSVDCCP